MKKFIILAVLSALLSGCSHMSVSHLPQKPFQPDQPGALSMRFLDIEYLVKSEAGKYVVRGTAFPNTGVLPGWAEWLHDFSLSVYISDESGTVVASDLVSFLPQKLTPEGVGFAFILPSELFPAGKDAFIAFGYRMNLTQSRYRGPFLERPLTGEMDFFPAIQGALPR